MDASNSGSGLSRAALAVQAVQRGVRWLKERTETADGLTESRDIAITIAALVAAERSPHSHLIQRLVGILTKKQSENGSWGGELWDTAWAVRAIQDVGRSADDLSLKRAIRFFEATQDPMSGTWYEEPFETMLVLDAIARLSADKLKSCSERSLQWLASLQRPDGCIIGIRYTGMAASLFMLVKMLGLARGAQVAELGLQYIRSDIAQKPIWTAASWSNYYPLKALFDSGASGDDAIVTKAVDWFLESQDSDGKWMQVSKVHDTAMAILALSGLLTTPLIECPTPRSGVLNATKENGTIRISFHGPGAGAITPTEKMKISDQIRSDLSVNQQLVISALGVLRSKSPESVPRAMTVLSSVQSELEKAGQYAYGHLIPPRIQLLLAESLADHLRLDIDERLIDLPWELIHDGTEFLCLRYAIGRRIVTDQSFVPPGRHPRSAKEISVLIVADPTSDLPAARDEGRSLTQLLRDKCGLRVDAFTEAGMSKKDFLLSLKNYDIVHFAGHASHDPSNPDESCLALSDGDIQAFEIARFIATRSPAVVFLNACWSAEELRDPKSYSPMMRGLGRTFLYAGVTAFIGYLVPVPDDSATKFAISFYESLAQGQTIGESLRQARIVCRSSGNLKDLTWSSAVLYGDPAACAVINSAR